MNDHNCEAIIITCIDYRLQDFINEWINTRFNGNPYDRVALGGGIFDIFYILRQIEISVKLHHVKKVILINHEDCGAYGKAGTYEKHLEDLAAAEKKIEALFGLDVETYYLHLDGVFEEVSRTNPKTVISSG